MDLVFIVFIILIILLALILVVDCICGANGATNNTVRKMRGGGGTTAFRGGAAHPSRNGDHHTHALGNAIYQHAREVFFDHDAYVVRGGRAARPTVSRAAVGRRTTERAWHTYETWKDLHNDEVAVSEYFKQRERILNNPNLDWSAVLQEVEPKLAMNREYIGIANLGPDGKTLVLSTLEASPTSADNEKSAVKFASIPSDMVTRIASKPGLILFHTHPNNERASPLPSSHDLSTAIFLGSASRFAACAVISRYGVLMHGLDWPAYTAMDTAEDWKLVALNLSFDVISAHEAIRSWSQHTLEDYFKFYARHKLISFVFPSSELVGDMRKNKWTWDIEAPTDFDIINDHINDIKAHIKNRGAAKKTNINVTSMRFM